MSYQRVIPRDLFNEASLLKCYGKLWLELEQRNLPHVSLSGPPVGEAFDVQQDWSSGAVTIRNVILRIDGWEVALWRPLNSREPWPLYCPPVTVNGDDIAVFTNDGELSPEFLAKLR